MTNIKINKFNNETYIKFSKLITKFNTIDTKTYDLYKENIIHNDLSLYIKDFNKKIIIRDSIILESDFVKTPSNNYELLFKGKMNIYLSENSVPILKIAFDYIEDDYYLVMVSLINFDHKYNDDDYFILNKYFQDLGIKIFYFFKLDQKSELNRFCKSITEFVNNNNFINGKI